MGDLPLAGGGTAGVRHRRGASRPFLTGLVGPEGWLDGMAAGDLIAVRVEGEALHVEQLDPDALDEQAGDRTAARLAETIEALGGANVAGGPFDVPELLLETLARAPLTLARPQPPLGELLERAGLAVDDHAVAPVDEAGAEQEAEPDDDEFLTDVYGLDDHGVLAHRAVLTTTGPRGGRRRRRARRR